LQDCIVAAYVTREHFKLFITTSVVAKHVIGDYNCRIVHDNDSSLIFYVRLPSLWQNRLNYSGSSAQTIAIHAT
jgi:hypothetical protein